jgi:Zn-dependent protease with chaperone function
MVVQGLLIGYFFSSDFTRTFGYVLFTFLGPLYMLLIVAVLLQSRSTARLRDLAERLSNRRFLQTLIYAVLFELIFLTLYAPFSLSFELIVGRPVLSLRELFSWYGTHAPSRSLFDLITILAFALTIRSRPRYWLACCGIFAVIFYVGPALPALITNDRSMQLIPLTGKDPELSMRLRRMLDRAGLKLDLNKVAVRIGPNVSGAINAEVTGIGTSERIIIWDGVLQKLSTNQALFVLAHEIGHYELENKWIIVIIGGAAFVIGFYLLFQGYLVLIKRYSDRWALRSSADIAGYPLFLLLVGLAQFFSAPLINTYGRYRERRATIYALDLMTCSVPNASKIAAETLRVMESESNEPQINSFEKFWFSDHPPVNEEIALVLSYPERSRSHRFPCP